MFHKGNSCPVKLRQLDVSRHSSSAEYALKQKENPSSWFSLCSSKLSLNSCLTRTDRPVAFPRKKSFKCYIWRCIWHFAKRFRSQRDEQASRGQLRYLFHFFFLSLFLRNSFSLSSPEVHEVLAVTRIYMYFNFFNKDNFNRSPILLPSFTDGSLWDS